MRFLSVRLDARGDLESELWSFYRDTLGFEEIAPTSGDDLVSVQVGITSLRFSRAAPGTSPSYHFALLIPGDRFAAAHDWLGSLVELLRDPATGDTIFEFEDWAAEACYLLDPAGNIVEVIAHRGIAESGGKDEFGPREFVGFSELGLVVGDKSKVAELLATQLDLSVWDGDSGPSRRLAFVGERAHTLILVPPGRAWLPTEHLSEARPLDVLLAGERAASVELPGSQRIAIRPQSARLPSLTRGPFVELERREELL